MKFNHELGGYFENGKFSSITSEYARHDFSKGLKEKSIEIISAYDSLFHENLILNLVCMPDASDMENIGELNIYLIYKEAYLSIALGNYNAGLLLLGQVMEVVTKEIILINTGEKETIKSFTFGQAIEYADKKCLLEFEDIQFLKKFNKLVRIVYSHYKLSEIIGHVRLPAWRFHVLDEEGKFNPGRFLTDLPKLQNGIREGTYKPTFIDPLEFPPLAASLKEDIDRKKAFLWLWQTNTKLEQFNKLYLSHEKYESYFNKFGRPYKEIEAISL